MKLFCIALFIISSFINNINADTGTVVIIPFYKQGENKTAIIEEDPCYRKVETKIKAMALQEADLQVIDYLALVRKIGKDQMRNMLTETDIIKKLVQEADPDIYIIADIEKYKGRSTSNGKTEYAIRVNLTAHQSNTGRTVAAILLDSGRRYYQDCHSLMEKAFMNKDDTDARKIELFIQQLIINPVSTVSIEFNIAKGSDSKYTSKLSNSQLLVMEIKNWVKKNSANNKSDPQISSTYISFREILMPQKEGAGGAYTPSDYALDFLIHLSSLSYHETSETLEWEFDVSGNIITYTLQ